MQISFSELKRYAQIVNEQTKVLKVWSYLPAFWVYGVSIILLIKLYQIVI